MAYGYSSNPGPDPGDEEMDDLSEKVGREDEGEESIDQEAREKMKGSAVVPIEVLQANPEDEVKVGDERVVKVMKITGNQALVKYAPEKKGKEGEGEEEMENEEGMHEGIHEDKEDEEFAAMGKEY